MDQNDVDDSSSNSSEADASPDTSDVEEEDKVVRRVCAFVPQFSFHKLCEVLRFNLSFILFFFCFMLGSAKRR